MKRVDVRLGLLLALVFLVSCSGGGSGCSSCASSCGGNPNYKFKGKVLKDGMQTRLTQAGMDFITRNLKPILVNTLAKTGQKLECSGSGITIPNQAVGNGPQVNGKYVKPTSSNCITKLLSNGKVTSCSGQSPKSTWFYGGLNQNNVCATIATNSLQIQLDEAKNEIVINFNIPELQLRTKAPDIGVCVKQSYSFSVISGDACGSALIALDNVRFRLTKLAGKVRLAFKTDPKTGKIGLNVVPGGITFATSTKFELLVNRCKSVEFKLLRIPVVNRDLSIKLGGSFCTSLIKLITGAVNGLSFLQPLIFRLLGDLISREIAKTNLLADARVDMEVPLKNLLGGLGLSGLGDSKPLGVSIAPGQALKVVRGGLNLSFNTGFESNPSSRCVPKRPDPTDTPGPAPSLTGNYHLGAALSRSAINRLMGGVYHSGALCLSLKSTDLGSGGGFSLNAGVLGLLAPKLTQVVPQDAPVLIKIQPTKLPTVDFGTGTKVNGKTDSTVKLFVPGFGISFYVFLHDRYVRIFTMETDLRVGLSLNTTPKNELEINFDTDTLKLSNAKVKHAYMVQTADISKLLPTLVNLVLQALGNNKLSFPLDVGKSVSDALGVPINVKINAIKRDGPARDWLALTLTMSNKSAPLLPMPQTVASVHDLKSLLKKGKNGTLLPTGEVHLQVPEFLGDRKLEYQYYVNSGGWSDFHLAPNGILKVRSHALKMLGKHRVYLRARIQGEYRSLEEDIARVDFTFDPLAPRVVVQYKDNHLYVTASDAVTSRDNLIFEYRRAQGDWKEMDASSLDLKDFKGYTGNIEIRVKDEQNNARTVRWSMVSRAVTASNSQRGVTGPTPASGPNGIPAFACSVDGQQQQLPVWLFLFLLLPLLRRRRR